MQRVIRKQSNPLQAIRYNGTNIDEVCRFYFTYHSQFDVHYHTVTKTLSTSVRRIVDADDEEDDWIGTDHTVRVGDWIIEDGRRRFVVTNKEFADNYIVHVDPYQDTAVPDGHVRIDTKTGEQELGKGADPNRWLGFASS